MAFILRKSEHFPCYDTVSVFSVTLYLLFALLFSNFSSAFVNFSRISSVGRAVDCRAGGRGFDSRDRTNTLDSHDHCVLKSSDITRRNLTLITLRAERVYDFV